MLRWFEQKIQAEKRESVFPSQMKKTADPNYIIYTI